MDGYGQDGLGRVERIGVAGMSRRRLLAMSGVALTAVGLPAAVAGAQATPGATPAPAGVDEALVQFIRFVHPEKVYRYLPGLDDEMIAAMYGLDVATYQAVRERFEAETRAAAEDLLTDPAFSALMDRLPFVPGSTVVGIGESDMDDRLSWFEILRHLIALRRPDDGIVVTNAAISGQSTAEWLAGLVGILEQQPAWIVCGVGGNDAVRYGRAATKTRIGIEETERNLVELRHLAAEQSEAEWLWITRWPVDEARIAAFPGFQQSQFSLSAADMDAVSEAVRRQEGPVVDLDPVIGRPPRDGYLGADGLHPEIPGHRAIVRAVVERLTV
jgi:acyl-CoA thioesterase-1